MLKLKQLETIWYLLLYGFGMRYVDKYIAYLEKRGIFMQIDAKKFDLIARNVFAPAYSLLAEQIMERTGIMSGLCLDLGSGGGYLGLALAWNSKLRVCLLDESEEMGDSREKTFLEKAAGHTGWWRFAGMSITGRQEHRAIWWLPRFGLFWDDCPGAAGDLAGAGDGEVKVCIGGGFGFKGAGRMRSSPRCARRAGLATRWESLMTTLHDAVQAGGIPTQSG